MELKAQTQAAVVGSMIGSVCDEVPRVGSRLRVGECGSKGRGRKMGAGRTACAVDGTAVCGAGRHSMVGPSMLLNGSGLKSSGFARRGSKKSKIMQQRGKSHQRAVPGVP